MIIFQKKKEGQIKNPDNHKIRNNLIEERCEKY